MAVESDYYGTWKIVECVSLSSPVEPTRIEGTLFHLDESGDVSWKVADDAEPMPFFSCETHEISLGEPAVLKFFGAFDGHGIEFRAEVSDDLMLLTYERCCMLQCQKFHPIDPKDEAPFSLLNALEEGYFSDLTITSASGKQFPVHSIALQLAVPGVNWRSTASPCPLSGLADDVTSTILHYMYAECLPPGLSEETARQCVKVTGKMTGFSAFVQLCETFLKNTALKHQITSLVEDMHACTNKIIDMFSGKLSPDAPAQLGPEETLMANPAKLSYVVKQALREAAVAGAKLLILCDLFSRRKCELSREERHEIIKYAKSRLPIFMEQLRKFLEVCKKHSSTLTPRQRQEIATYLVPELEDTFDTLCTFMVEARTALEHIIQISSHAEKEEHKHKKAGHMGEVLGKTLKNALHMRELMKMKRFNEKTTGFFNDLMEKKETYTLMTQDEKIRSLSKSVEQIVDEIPLFLVRIEELMAALSEKVTWREWKYLFKLGTSKVAWVLSKMLLHNGTLVALIKKACDMVHRDQFTQCLATLGLADPSSTASAYVPPSSKPSISDDCSTSSGGAQSSKATTTKYAQLSAVESLCKPPYAAESRLAMEAQTLLHSRTDTDMVFEIISTQDHSDAVIEHTDTETSDDVLDPKEAGGEGDEGGVKSRNIEEEKKEVEIHLMPAHRVIVAARCHWFRRALLSGMRESIDKKITVHDSCPQLFALLLDYLYHGQLDTRDFTTDQLADLLALADRYEVDSLKVLCERSLRQHIDDNDVLCLLSLADQYNARNLRSSCLNYVLEHPGVTESDVFDELPESLQSELEGLVSWHRPSGTSTTSSSTQPPSSGASAYRHHPRPRHRHRAQHSSSGSSSEDSSVDDLIRALDLDEQQAACRGARRAGVASSDSSTSDELGGYLEDSVRLEACVTQLVDIVGDVPRSNLVRVALAADYDVNRALNYLYESLY